MGGLIGTLAEKSVQPAQAAHPEGGYGSFRVCDLAPGAYASGSAGVSASRIQMVEGSMKGLLQTLLRIFIVGAIAVLPLVITVGVVVWVSGVLSRWFGRGTPLGRAVQAIGMPFGNETVAYVAGWLLVLALIFGLGVLVEMGARRFLVDRLDRVARRVPVLGGVYGTVRQFADLMDTKDKADLKGMSVVWVLFGGERGAAFLALLPTPERFRIADLDYHAVVIPSAPVPVGGSLIFVPVGSVRPANVSMDGFMSVYVSMGVTGGQFLERAEGTLRMTNDE